MNTTDLAKMDAPALRALIAQMAARPANKLSMKVTVARPATDKDKGSKGGALSVYGLGRFPVTLYRTQWERLLNEADTIREFIAANAASLATKD
jgi:hypothetical protein